MKLKYFYILLAVASLGLAACEKDFMQDGDASFNGTFSPYGLAAQSVSNTPQTKVEFTTAPNTKECVIQFSTDSLNFETANLLIDETVALTDSAFSKSKFSKSYRGLLGNTNYFIRVKSVSSVVGNPDSKWLMIKYKTPAENLFQRFIGENGSTAKGQISLVWEGGNAVTHIRLLGDDASDAKYPISSAEAIAGRKVIAGLTPDVTYEASLLKDDLNRGTVSIKVLGNPIIKTDEELLTALSSASDGDVIVLQAGAKFTLPAKFVMPAVTLQGAAGSSRAVLTPTDYLLLPASGNKVSFENIELDGGSSANNIIYQNNGAAAVNIKQLVFENCYIHDFKQAPIRLANSASTVVDEISINNSVLTRVISGNYAIVHMSAAGATVKTVSLSNSTAYSIGGSVMRLEGSNANTLQSVSISNCTISDISTYFIRLSGTQTSQAKVEILNTILGKSATGTDVLPKVSGNSISVSVDNSFRTNDFDNAKNGITFTDYQGAVQDLFVAPANGDFRFKDESFVGKLTAGDPRWK